jgi:hypothetical protein
MRSPRPRLLALLIGAVVALVVPSVAGAAEIVDRNVAIPSLRVNGSNVALVTYSVRGHARNVLYWDAVDWTERFKRDYSGGWKSKIANHKRFTNRCKPYTGPPLALTVAACDAPDGSHWALQQWQRLWDNYGGSRAANELYISHWRGDVGELLIQTDHSYHGKHQHLWGKFTFHGKPVYGTGWTSKGVPTDRRGRNVYLDYLDDAHWRRVNSFLTHPPTAGFCYTFASHPASASAWNGQGTGEAYRATAIGPGVTPLVQTHFAPPGGYDPTIDAVANDAQGELLGSDGRCRID